MFHTLHHNNIMVNAINYTRGRGGRGEVYTSYTTGGIGIIYIPRAMWEVSIYSSNYILSKYYVYYNNYLNIPI